jgi:uncharacterized membrane protein
LTARLRKLLNDLSETFWVIPGLMVLAGVLGAIGLVQLDRDGIIPQWALDGAWLYNGGATGARTLLGAVASSTIAVAGTVFSITIAALSLAAGQMGPRLLHNFTRDRGNQFTLGAFLGTFAFALMVLRSVRTEPCGPGAGRCRAEHRDAQRPRRRARAARQFCGDAPGRTAGAAGGGLRPDAVALSYTRPRAGLS